VEGGVEGWRGGMEEEVREIRKEFESDMRNESRKGLLEGWNKIKKGR
jgi:hypothetical protein